MLLANADGTQKIDDTGPLTIKRMETVDGEFLDASLKFMEKAVKTTSRSSAGGTRHGCTSSPT